MATRSDPGFRDAYWRDGFAFPLRLLSAAQAAGYRARLEAAMASHPDTAGMAPYIKTNSHFLFPFADDLIHEPALLDAAEAILGPDIMVWSTSIFLKQPGSPGHVTWHQDLTYWGIGATDQEVTLWLALSPATEASGCLRFLPASHKWQIVEHRDTFEATNMLTRGQEIAVAVNEDEAVPVCLQPGEASLHHGRLAHASGPNRSADPRIGLAIRYIAPTVRQEVGSRDYARLVRGADRHGHFLAPPRPQGEPGEAEISRWRVIADEVSHYFYQGASEEHRLRYSEH